MKACLSITFATLATLALAVAAPAGAGELSIRLLPGNVLRVGDVLRIRVTSPLGGWLHVYDMRDGGGITKLFPGECNRGRKIRAGRPVTIPSRASGCEFAADAPGKGRIVVVVSEEERPLSELASALPATGKRPASAAVPAAGDDARWRTLQILPYPPGNANAKAVSGAAAPPAGLKAILTRLKNAGSGDDWLAAEASYRIVK